MQKDLVIWKKVIGLFLKIYGAKCLLLTPTYNFLKYTLNIFMLYIFETEDMTLNNVTVELTSTLFYNVTSFGKTFSTIRWYQLHSFSGYRNLQYSFHFTSLHCSEVGIVHDGI
jgi:hypothetical protein